MSVFTGKWLILSLLGLLGFSHPYYISVTEIEYLSKDKEIGISCKIFTDDFEKHLTDVYQTKVDLYHPADKAGTGKLISDYILKHLHFRLDGKDLQPVFIGFEREEEATWSYFSIKGINAIHKMEITNDLLYDYKSEQINIMHMIVDGNRKSTRLINPEKEASFEFP